MRSGALPGFAEVIDQAPDAIVLIDATGSIVYANQRVSPLFGYSAAALVGQPVEALVPERLRMHHVGYRQSYARDPKVRPMGDSRLTLTGRRADGSEFPVDIHLAPIRSDGHRWTLGVIRDATERHRFLDELHRIGIANDQLQVIFEDFNRLAEGRAAHGEGFGLGLGIVRRLSTVLGLSVTVESAPGHGSTFRVQIPPEKVFHIA